MDADEVFNKSRSLTPLGRLGTDEEIANVAYFLFSKESSFVNGTTIVAGGGYKSLKIVGNEFWKVGEYCET